MSFIEVGSQFIGAWQRAQSLLLPSASATNVFACWLACHACFTSVDCPAVVGCAGGAGATGAALVAVGGGGGVIGWHALTASALLAKTRAMNKRMLISMHPG
jgi:hypothetical protein